MTTMRKGRLAWVLGFWLAAGGIAAAQTPPPAEESPQQNVQQSRQYERLLCTNAGFRAQRIAKECGPLQGSQFYDSCVASFNCQHPASDANWRHAPPSETISK
jgi:hypothetical protein